MDHQRPNHLIHQSSPYLQQHAYNPVDWWPWNTETLEMARAENKLMLISIGYSACHWCHVMERESFMNKAVASLMNENYISVKVDREERPDIDQVYMQAAYIITGSGGWPLNVIALPDGRPVYAGTYFPTKKWMEVLEYFSELHQSQNELLINQAENITSEMKGTLSLPGVDDETVFEPEQLERISAGILNQTDPEDGGLYGAPKFPMPVVFEYLLHYYYVSGDEKALNAVNTTLKKMAAGGIYDHIGGGFSRYSTDAQWKVPHFEKMLYDNAQLISLYSYAYSINKDPQYKDVILSTLRFIQHEMTSAEGSFYSSLDADSEGKEGLFYTWEMDEILELAGAPGPEFCEYYQVTREGNWTHNKNILWRKEGYGNKGNSPPEVYAEIRKILLTARSKRVRPALDDKILTSWNALMLKGLINAYQVLGDETILSLALKNAAFLETWMLTEERKVYRNFHRGTASISGFLDDYAFLAEAYILLYRATFNEKWLYLALEITKYAISHFYDHKHNRFYYTSDEDPELILRPSEYSDNVIPSSASSITSSIYYLNKYFDLEDFRKIYDRLMLSIKPQLLKNPVFHSAWARLALTSHHKQIEVVIAGKQADKRRKEIDKHFIPGILLSGGEKRGTLSIFEYKYIKGKTLIYVCKDKRCFEPVELVPDALALIKSDGVGSL